MKIVSNTTRISDDSWKELIRFCKPSGLNTDGMIFQFQQRKGPGTSGRAWRMRRKVHLRVGNNYGVRRISHRKPHAGYLESWCYTFEEEIIHVLAHELRHQWQYVNPRGHRVWGSRAQVSERDADAYAIHVVREWRRHKQETPDLKTRLVLFKIVRNTERVAASHS